MLNSCDRPLNSKASQNLGSVLSIYLFLYSSQKNYVNSYVKKYILTGVYMCVYIYIHYVYKAIVYQSLS